MSAPTGTGAHPLVVGHDVRAPELHEHQVTRDYRDVFAAGDRVEFPTYVLDTVGLPSWWSVGTLGPGEPPAQGHGYGGNDADARRSSWGESAELGLLRRRVRELPVRRASFGELVAELGERAVVEPPRLCLDAGAPYTRDTVLTWLPVQRWGTGETVWVPADVVRRDAADVPAACTADPADGLVTLMGNGLGAGDRLERALAHGLGELLQRDGNGTRFRAMDEGVVIDLGPGDADVHDPVTRGALASLRSAGVEVQVKLAGCELGQVNLFVVGADENPLQPVMVTAAGEAAHPDREVALRKALLEFCAARSRKAFTHGSLEAVEAISPPGYLARFAADPAGAEPRALRGMLRWLSMSSAELLDLLAPVVLARRRSVRFGGLPTWTPAEGADPSVQLCDNLTGRLAREGFDVLYLDCTPPDSPVSVVRAIVPGLEVETMSYGRVGERGVRDLLARGDGRTGLHGIVGLGVPGGAGVPATAVPVHLTAAATERLGGPAWLDRAAIDRVLGDLYPLYREPALHAAAVAHAKGWTA